VFAILPAYHPAPGNGTDIFLNGLVTLSLCCQKHLLRICSESGKNREQMAGIVVCETDWNGERREKTGLSGNTLAAG